MFAGKKSAQIREILISESAWEEMTCLFAPSLNAVAARYGGEEFVVILPEAELELAKKIAETITHNIINEKLIHEASPFGVVSVSTGVSHARAADLDDDGTSLIESADTALYRAKFCGRNQVSVI